MLKLMYDGREFRLSDGRKVNLADANICVDDVTADHTFYSPETFQSFDMLRVEASYYSEVKRFDTEFDFELWRNSCKPSGLYKFSYHAVTMFVWKGEKVRFKLDDISIAPAYYSDVSLFGVTKRMMVPNLQEPTRLTFLIPLYKENQ